MPDKAYQVGGVWVKLVDIGERLTPLLDEAAHIPLYALAVREQSDDDRYDEVESAHVVVPLMLHKIHKGDYWEVDNVMASVKNDDAINVLIVTDNNNFHYSFNVSGGGDLEWSLYEGAMDSGGTPVTPRNLRRPIGDLDPPITARINVVVEDYGTRLTGNFVAGGTGGQTVGSGIYVPTKRILKADTAYLLEAINRAGKAKRMGMLIQGYKE